MSGGDGGRGEVRTGSPGGVSPVLLRGSRGRETPLSAAVQYTSLVWSLPAPVHAAPSGGGLSSSLRQPFPRTAERRRFAPHLPVPRAHTELEGGRARAHRLGERGAEGGKSAPPAGLGGSDGRATAGALELTTLSAVRAVWPWPSAARPRVPNSTPPRTRGESGGFNVSSPVTRPGRWAGWSARGCQTKVSNPLSVMVASG